MFGIEACMAAVSFAKSMEGMTSEQRKEYLSLMSIPKTETPKDNSSNTVLAGLIGFIFGLSL